jgi:hypothetical protein
MHGDDEFEILLKRAVEEKYYFRRNSRFFLHDILFIKQDSVQFILIPQPEALQHLVLVHRSPQPRVTFLSNEAN